MTGTVGRAAGVALTLLLLETGAHASPLSAEDAAALLAEVRALRAKVETLEQRLADNEARAQAEKHAEAKTPEPVAISWKGSPQFIQDDRAFKVKGRIQYDVGYVDVPGRSPDRGLGFASEARRIRLGGEGSIGSGFGYKLELELSDNQVDLVDTFITYETGPWRIALGNQNQFQSLDELTGDTSGSFMERAAFTDAFNFERRVGISAQYHRKALLLQAGLFTDDVDALANSSDGPSGGDENNSFGLDGRLVLAPKVGDTQLHFGSSVHWRRLGRIAETPVRYRQRPFLHTTNSRLIGTSPINVTKEISHGLEFAAIRGRWHVAAETHWLRAVRAGATNPGFFGSYAELGYFLTSGDTRSYKAGIFGATKPKSSIRDGGPGAIQVNLRYDYLDLNGQDIRGGTQNAYLASIIWTPLDVLRLNLNYGRIDYDGATMLPDGRTRYGAHVLGARMELDF